MVKKIFLGTIFAGLVGLLIFGAVNRTIAKNEGPVSRGLNQANEVSGVLENQEEIEVSAGNGLGRGGGQGRTNQNETGENGECSEQGDKGIGRNYQGSGSTGIQDRAGQGKNSNWGASESSDHSNTNLLYFEGTVETITPEAVIIKSAEGNDVIIEGRAWRFAQDMGYSLQIGQTVNITGFEEDGEFKPVEISVYGSGSAFQFRESSGRPMWAGRGQGKGGSQSGQDI